MALLTNKPPQCRLPMTKSFIAMYRARIVVLGIYRDGDTRFEFDNTKSGGCYISFITGHSFEILPVAFFGHVNPVQMASSGFGRRRSPLLTFHGFVSHAAQRSECLHARCLSHSVGGVGVSDWDFPENAAPFAKKAEGGIVSNRTCGGTQMTKSIDILLGH